MLERVSWRSVARIVLFALAGACLLGALAAFEPSRIRWPSGPNAAYRLRSLADLATAMTCLGVAAAGMIHNARRIGRGETLWRAPAALAGGVGVFVALLSVWWLGEIAVGLAVDPIRSSDQTWLLGLAAAPVLGLTAATGAMLLMICFGDRMPAAAHTMRLLLRALSGVALVAGLAAFATAARAQAAEEAVTIAAPMALGLIGLSFAVASRARLDGWALTQAVAGYLLGAFCALNLSLIVAGFFAAYDPRAIFLYWIFFAPVGLAVAAVYAAAGSLAAGRVADGARRLGLSGPAFLSRASRL